MIYMIKGNNRRVILLKNTGSEIFDEALFFLRDGAEKDDSIGEGDMINEANRIVSSNLLVEYCSSRKKIIKTDVFKWFLAGAGSTGAIGALILMMAR